MPLITRTFREDDLVHCADHHYLWGCMYGHGQFYVLPGQKDVGKAARCPVCDTYAVPVNPDDPGGAPS